MTKCGFNDQNNEQYLYKYLRERINDGANIKLKPIIILGDIKYNYRISNQDLCMMELALIHEHQPMCNIEGRLKEYKIR